MPININCDYLVIGGGAAGCIVAKRLAQRLPDAQILLVEAGESDEHNPAATQLSRLDEQVSSDDWGYQANTTIDSPFKMAYARAKMLGGCANHNDCAFLRPPPGDFERWVALGAKGWDYQSLETAFNRLEESIHIDQSPPGNALSKAFIDASIECGLFEHDFRQSIAAGTGWFPLNALGDLRQSSSITYLHPLKTLPKNLTVLTSTQVSKLLFEQQSVIGAETNRGIISAHAEVILCAGSINSPQLLMLSGIGPAQHLNDLDIPLIKDLPGVGQNLIDHVAANVAFELKSPSPAWQRTPCEATSLILVDKDQPAPDILFHFVLRLREKYAGSNLFAGVKHGVKLSPNVARPKSRGWIRLNPENPQGAPQINLNYLSDAAGYDRRLLVAGLRYARDIASKKALAPYLGAEISPGSNIQSDQDLISYILETCETVYHPCGSCAMGDTGSADTVVSPELKVKGIQGLRIADASIFPDMVSVNICNTVMMVAEFAADFITTSKT